MSITADSLLDAASQLETGELIELSDRVSRLAAQRRGLSLSQAESELLQRINRPKPDRLARRHKALLRKQDEQDLTQSEYRELLALTAEAEAFDVERLRALVELAQVRGRSLPDLMRDLGIVPPGYD